MAGLGAEEAMNIGSGGGGVPSSSNGGLSSSRPVPLIVSCIKCRNIVGDTYSYIGSERLLNLMTLSAVCNVKRSQTTVMTSKTGHDAGCTYVNIFCVGCDETIGKYYITTSRAVDRLRDKFSLFIDKVSVYQVGSANMGSYPEPEVLLQHEKPDTAQEDMLKIKEVLLSLHDKITSLESRMMSLEAHVFPAHGGGGNNSGHLTNYSLVREQSVSSTYRVVENKPIGYNNFSSIGGGGGDSEATNNSNFNSNNNNNNNNSSSNSNSNNSNSNTTSPSVGRGGTRTGSTGSSNSKRKARTGGSS